MRSSHQCPSPLSSQFLSSSLAVGQKTYNGTSVENAMVGTRHAHSVDGDAGNRARPYTDMSKDNIIGSR